MFRLTRHPDNGGNGEDVAVSDDGVYFVTTPEGEWFASFEGTKRVLPDAPEGPMEWDGLFRFADGSLGAADGSVVFKESPGEPDNGKQLYFIEGVSGG
jgi:hypothetical protein